MIRKHLIPFAIGLSLLVMAKVFAHTQPTGKTNLKNSIVLADNTVKTNYEEEEEEFTIEDLEFANEGLPEGDQRVANKMKQVLASYGYENLQSTRLYRKATEWFPVIEPILAKHGIPNDFKYIPLVESGFREGVSPKGAAGIWQFMPATAKGYGLKVNAKVDERYNLKKSTEAACKYLKELHRIFGSWTLVAAAYNVGDNHLKKQITRQNQDNYFKMKLNRETGAYVYKLMSVKEILENPKRNGYKNQKALIAYNENPSFTME
ncbi:MAG: lytic transglycosylase domain-containing protein [Pedobacter sp.]|nr:MAG: lytic transglycosylase domain-containing protein [Pedobacter sp.]